MPDEHLKVCLDLQNALTDSAQLPEPEQMEQWVYQTLRMQLQQQQEAHQEPAAQEYELTIRVVDRQEMRELNKTYRQQDKATNVLSFPFSGGPCELPEPLSIPLLGDLLICHDVVLEQAAAQGKTALEHWAHMVVHGVLHLRGYDHIDDDEAKRMEALEIAVLAQLSISNPYE